MHVETGRYFLPRPITSSYPQRKPRRRPRHALDSLRHNLPSENSSKNRPLSFHPDWWNPGFGLAIVSHRTRRAQYISHPPFPLARAIMSSSSVTACSRSPSPATPDTSEVPDSQMSLKSWRSTVPSNAVSPCLTLTLTGLSSSSTYLRTMARKASIFTTSSEKQSLTGAQRHTSDRTPILTVTI